MKRLVLIEFVADTGARKTGERIRCDAASAVSLCDRKKVAVRVGQERPVPVIPAPANPVDDTDHE